MFGKKDCASKGLYTDVCLEISLSNFLLFHELAAHVRHDVQQISWVGKTCSGITDNRDLMFEQTCSKIRLNCSVRPPTTYFKYRV